MPANGFENTDSGKKTIRLDNGEKFTVIREEYSKGTDKIIAWYWYQTGDRRMSSEYLQKFYMILDGIFKRRTDVAFIRITINTDAQGVKSAEKTFEKFVKVLVPALNQIIPN
jgi:EpsI family protein